MENLEVYVGAAVAITGLIWGIVKIVVRLTPTKKDDAVVFDKVDPVVEKVVGSLKPKDEQPKP